MIRIGLFWHSFYSGNLGVSALSDANMRLIVEAAADVLPGEKIVFTLFGPRGDTGFRPPSEHADAKYVVVSSPKHLPSITQEIRACDLIFDIGGGDSFADIYGVKRLAKIGGLKYLARFCGRRPILSPQTIGPFSGHISRAFGRNALSMCKHVCARDDLSLERARALMGKRADTALSLATDVAFALPVLEDWPEAYPEIEDDKIHIGVNVSGLLYSGGYTGDNQFGLTLDYPALIENLINLYSSRDGHVIWLIPHVYKFSKPAFESDLTVAQSLVEKHPGLRLAPIFHHAREAKTFLSRMDLVCAARMHVAIGAVSTGTACVPMSYSLKFQGLFGSLGYPHVLDLKSANMDTALIMLENSLGQIDALASQAQVARDKAMQMLDSYRGLIRSELAALRR